MRDGRTGYARKRVKFHSFKRVKTKNSKRVKKVESTPSEGLQNFNFKIPLKESLRVKIDPKF